MRRHLLCVGCVTALMVSRLAGAEPPPPAAAPRPIEVKAPAGGKPVSYARDVADVLAEKCTGCHGSALAESKLSLEDPDAMRKGGKRGPVLVPGKAEASLLFKLGAHRENPAMPPIDKKELKPLSPEELGLIKSWIDAGAIDDSAEYEPKAAELELGAIPAGVQPVAAIDITADGRRIAFGRGNAVELRETDTGVSIRTIAGLSDIVQAVRISPDGRLLAIGGYREADVWTMPVAVERKPVKLNIDQTKTFAISADRKTIALGPNSADVVFLDPATAQEIGRLSSPGGAPTALAISAEGSLAAIGSADGVIRIAKRSEPKRFFELKGHTGPIKALAFGPQGRSLASGAGDGSAGVWQLTAEGAGAPNGDPLFLRAGGAAVNSVAWAQEGREVVAGGDDGMIRVWHSADGKLARDWRAHSGPILSMALSPDGTLVLTGSKDQSAALSSLNDAKTLKLFREHSGPVVAAAFSPAGATFLTGGEEGAVIIRDTATGQGVIAQSHKGDDEAAPPSAVRAAGYVDERAIVSLGANPFAGLWSYEGRWSELARLPGHVFRVLAIDFSPGGDLLATGGGDPTRSGEVKLWTLPKVALVRTFETLHSDTVFAVRFSPDGTMLATAAADKFAKLTEVSSGKTLKTFEGHTGHVLGVDWKPDGKQVVTAGSDNVIKLWDVNSGDQIRTFQAAGKAVTAVRWLQGGARVLGASADQNLRIWNADNGGVQANFSGAPDYLFCACASAKPNGRVAVGCADGTVLVWRTDNAQLIKKLDPPRTEMNPATAAK